MFIFNQRKARFIRAGLFSWPVLIALLLFITVTTFADEQNDQSGPVIPEFDSALSRLAASVRKNIDEINKEDPGNVALIAAQYQRLFDAFPETSEGRLAAIEVFLLFRRSQMHYQALGQAAQIIKTYSSQEFLPNLADETKPLQLVVTMRLERARIFSQMGNPLSAVEQLNSIPEREIIGYAGLVDGDRTYFGATDILIETGIIEALISGGETQQAYVKLVTLMRKKGDQDIYFLKSKRHLDRDLLDRLELIMQNQQWNIPRTIVELSRIKGDLQTLQAKARLIEMLAEAHLRNFALYQNRIDAVSARDFYLKNIAEHSEVVLESSTPEGALIQRIGEMSVDQIVSIYQERIHDPRGLLVVLSGIIDNNRERPEIIARCLLHQADVQFRFLNSGPEALKLYQKVMEHYGDLVYYPHVLPEVTRYKSVAWERISEINKAMGFQ